MQGSFQNISMVGVASMVPTKIVNNLDLINEKNEKMIRKQIRATGIKEKHCVSHNQTAVDLCLGAAFCLLEKLEWNPEEIKVLIYVSSYKLFVMPSTAFYIQNKLGVGMDCYAFDMNLSCSGFVAGIQTLGSLLQHCNEGEKGLLLVGATPSLDKKKLDTGIVSLFGDAGGVAAFEVREGNSTFFSQYSDGKRLSSLYKKNYHKPLYMDGMEVFNFAISDVADSINNFFDFFQVKREQVDGFFLHQAQKFIIEKMMEFCHLPAEKCPVSYEQFGNTDAVSIPLTMCHYANSIVYSGKKKWFLSGFGAGLSWGNVYLETDDLLVLPVIYSDETFEKEK